MGQVALRQDSPPDSQLRRSDAGVRRAGLAVEHGFQSLDVNVLLLITGTVSAAAQFKAGNQQRSKACPCTTDANRCKPLRRLYEARMHGESKVSWFLSLSLISPPRLIKMCTVRMLTRLGKEISASRFFRSYNSRISENE